MFKSIGKAISNAYNSVKNTVSNVFSSIGGKTNTANASNSPVFGSAAYMRQTASQGSTYGTGQKVSMGASGSWTPTLSAGQLSPGLNSGIASSTYGGGGSSSSQFVGPQLPVTISAGRQSTSSSPTLSLTGFNPSAYTPPATISAKSLGVSSNLQNNLGGSLQSTGGAIGTPVSLSSAPTSVNPGLVNTTGLAGTVAGYKQYNPKTGQLDDVAEPTKTQETLDERVKKQMDILKQYMPEKENVYEDPDVIAARNERQRLQQALQVPTAELNAIIAKQNQDLLQLRQTGSQEGVTEAVYGGQQNTINYNAAIRSLPLQASIAGIQGDLKLAQDYLAELTTVKQEQINRQYEYNKNQFEAIKGILTKEDQRAYDELKTENDRSYKEQQDLIKVQSELLTNALANNAPQTIINRINNAGSIQDAVMAAGQYATNLTSRAIENQQLANAKLQGEKLAQEIESNQPITGEYANIINGAAGLVPSTKKQQVKQNIAGSLANGDYKTAYAEISNAVSDGLTGTNKTKFDDANTDLGILSNVRVAIQNYSSAGGDMGLLKGTTEEIKRKLGIDSGKASVLATQLWREFQTYRSNMTGAAFTPAESRDYASVNPTLGKELDLNLNVIDGAMAQLGNRVNSTITRRIPDAQKIFDLAYGQSEQAQTINISGKDFTVGQLYEDANGNRGTFDNNGKWISQ